MVVTLHRKNINIEVICDICIHKTKLYYYTSEMKNIYWAIGGIFALCACGSGQQSEQEKAPFDYIVDLNKIREKPQLIEHWHVLGQCRNEMEPEDWVQYLKSPAFADGFKNPDPDNPIWYNGSYSPKYNQLDLKEVFGLQTSDTLQGRYTYLSCNLLSKQAADLFLNIRTNLEFTPYLNGQKLERRDTQGLNFYAIHLNQGDNRCVIRTKEVNNDVWIESYLLDSLGVATMYTNEQSNNIVFPLVSNLDKILTFTNAHTKILDAKVYVTVQDASGDTVRSFPLKRNVNFCKVEELLDLTSYLCTMEIAGKVVRQPFVCGDLDEVYARFVRKRRRLGDNHPRSKEIDQLLYRLDFLLKHDSRETDWWWQFKIAPITYQLEHTFTHLNQDFGEDDNEFNLKFVTYTSQLDGGQQRYLLVTPNNMRRDHKYPLVVVVRPHVVNHYPFFTSPQFTYQWTFHLMQGLANRYGFIVMMPEARMYLSEDVTPMANAELKLAIEHVSSHYGVDADRIYLHGVCSGGYRALKLAALNPGVFAAIGLYAPLYYQSSRNEWEERHSLSANIQKLSGTSVFVFADPNDVHSPYKNYEGLLDACRQYNLPLDFEQKINSTIYNVLLTGSEAFDFFDGKSRSSKGQVGASGFEDPDFVVADLYSEPFVYVQSKADLTGFYFNLVHSLSKDYCQYLDTNFPLILEDRLTDEILSTRNLFLIGDRFSNRALNKLVEQAKTESGKNGGNCLSIHRNMATDRKFVLLQVDRKNVRMLRFPWIEGTQKTFVPDASAR